jgi:hypothetical protein
MSENDEAEFDRQLLGNFAPISADVLPQCIAIDTEGSGYIDQDKFYEICDSLGLKIPVEVKDYIELLFYTDRNELDIVPYDNFLKAYS